MVIAACGDDNAGGDPAPSTTAAAATTAVPTTNAPATTAPPTTTAPTTTTPATTTPPTTTTPTTAAPTTTTATVTTVAVTRPEPTGPATFRITEVAFGAEGYVAITNVGGQPGSLAEHWLCQRPSYFALPAMDLVAPGETVLVATGDGAGLGGTVVAGNGAFGGFRVDGGEIGLYISASFGSADAIISYVEWGSTGHGRSGTAVAAGIWQAGDFVAPSTDAVAISLSLPDAPPSSASWLTAVP